MIVTEGEKTEPKYLNALRSRLRLSAIDVEIVHPEGTDPKTLVREALKQRDSQKKEAKRNMAVEYDEVWVVFDLEKPHDQRRRLAKEARNISGASELEFVESDPCFEYWLLLHQEYTTMPFCSCDVCAKKLRHFWPNYTKGSSLPEGFLDRIPTAVENAEHCREHHRSCGGDGNPSTGMDRLVRSLNEEARDDSAFRLNPKKAQRPT